MPSASEKPDAEILEVKRRRQHHRMRDVVVDERHGNLGGDRLVDVRDLAFPSSEGRGTRTDSSGKPMAAGSFIIALRFCLLGDAALHELLLLVAETMESLLPLGRMGNERHLHGRHLVLGQFVAQSELSVVITLAPDSGKWNVV